MTMVLVVDDEEELCEGLREMLEPLGLTVKCAFSGEEALKLIEANNFKLCIIDLKLSTAITGLDLIKTLRQKQPGALLIAMSGYIDSLLRHKAEECKIDGYIEKPRDLRQEIFSGIVQKLLTK